MGQSLSRDGQDILDAAAHGDVAWLRQQMAFEPSLVKSVTLVKRRGVLHLAAKEGHVQVINAVLEPLIEAVREEYMAHQALEEKESAAALDLQHQEAAPSTPAFEQQPPPVGTLMQQTTLQRSRQPELQLPSFVKLRQAVNARDLYRRTPLIVAAKQGHLECTKVLVEAASNLFAVDREGNTSLHYAALHGHAPVVDYLMKKASDRNLCRRFVNKRNLSGFTPLHYAVWGCNEQLVQQLLQAGSEISAVNDRVFDAWVTVPVGSTPLHLAVVRNHTPIAVMLLQQYVAQAVAASSDTPRPQDPRSVTNLYGMNPSQLAAHRGLRQLSCLLAPSLPLSRVLQAFEPAARRSYGPPSLKQIAAGVMQSVLDAQLDKIGQQQQAQLEAATCKAAYEEAATGAALGNSKAAPDATCDLCCCSSSSPPADGAGCCVQSCSCSSLSSSCMVMCDSIRRIDSEETYSAAVPATGTTHCASHLEILEAGDRGMSDTGEVSMECEDACCEGSCNRTQALAMESQDSSKSQAMPSPASISLSDQSAIDSHPSGEQCCVCWEEQLSVGITPCSHALCYDCARQLVANAGSTGATCPLCRRFIAGFELLDTAGGLRLVSGAGI